MDDRPVLTSTLLVEFAGSVIALVVAFGTPVSTEQKEAILGFIPSLWLVGIAFYFLVKPRIVSRPKAAILIEQAQATRGLIAAGTQATPKTKQGFLRSVELDAASQTKGME